MTERLLSSESLFDHLLQKPAFAEVVHTRTQQFMAGCAAAIYGGAEYARAGGDWASPPPPPPRDDFLAPRDDVAGTRVPTATGRLSSSA